MTNQRTACVNAIMSVLTDANINYELNGDVSVNEVLTPQLKEQVRAILFNAFRAGQVQYKESFQAKVDDDKELKSYISGLVNNWIRKAKEFNSGQAYKAKNPGSRAGSTDPQVKEMRKLLSVTSDEQAKVAIQAALDAKLSELKAAKQQVTINVDALPAELRAKLGL